MRHQPSLSPSTVAPELQAPGGGRSNHPRPAGSPPPPPPPQPHPETCQQRWDLGAVPCGYSLESVPEPLGGLVSGVEMELVQRGGTTGHRRHYNCGGQGPCEADRGGGGGGLQRGGGLV